MGVQHRLAHRQKEPPRGSDAERPIIAVEGGRLSVDQLHHQVGNSLIGRAAVQQRLMFERLSIARICPPPAAAPR
jgi:hypothetical protein